MTIKLLPNGLTYQGTTLKYMPDGSTVRLAGAAVPTVPAVTSQPSSTSVAAGTSANFAASFSGYPVPSYQWYRSINSGSTWTAISGATSATLTTAAATSTGGTANNGDQFRCTATNSEGSVNTNAVTLTVTAADVTAPVLSGSITISNISQTGFTADWSPATDNVAVTEYNFSLDGGTTWPITWSTQSYNFAGLTAATTYLFRVRAKDAAGNISNILAASVTTLSSGATITSEPLKMNNGVLLASKALTYVAVYNISTGALVVRKTGVSTDANGIFSFTDSALTPSVVYRLDWETAEGHRRMPTKVAT